MEREVINILLVEDIELVKSEIENYLEKIGFDVNIDLIIPKNIGQHITEILPDGEGLNKYDFSLVDLELYPLKRNIEYERDDLSGGTHVLPYLRKHSPWLPVIAESRLFDEISGYFFSIAGSFGFDGHFARHVFQSKSFNRRLWDTIIDNAVLNRKKEILGHEYDQRNEELDISIKPALRKELNSNLPTWENLLKDSFYFGDKLSVEKMSGGFSGAYALRGKIIRRNVFDQQESVWLIKMSNNPFKLQAETDSHLNIFRSGIEYARSVPLLYNKVLVEKGCGIIAYQFAEDTRIAEEIITDYEKFEIYYKDIISLLLSFYKADKRFSDTDDIRRITNGWFSNKRIDKLVKKHIELEPVSILKCLSCGEEQTLLDSSVKYTKCWLHGDLHLRNILMGERAILIDFARSKPGPIAVDLAILSSNLLLRLKDLRDNFIPKYNEKPGKLKILFGAIGELLPLDGDKILFNLYLKLFLAIALTYNDDDLASGTKAWLKVVLSN